MKTFRKIWHPMGLTGACLLVMVLVLHAAEARADWLQDLEADAVAWLNDARIPGMAMAIVKNDTVIYAKGFGHLSNDPSSPEVDADTVFNIGSCTKAFTAFQVAVLADRKRLAWSDRVAKHLTTFGMYDPWVNKQFEVEDLLCHRSGLSAYSLFSMSFLGYSPDSLTQAVRFKEPSTSFRSVFAYQNNMYVAATKLIEAKTGQSWKKNLSDTIFKPLGMTRSVTTQAEKNQMANVATGHLLLSDGNLWPIPRNWSNNFVDDNIVGAGAIKSTAHDMAQWVRLNLALGKYGDQQIVSETNMRHLQAPRVLVSPWANGLASPYWGPVSYGAGWMYFALSPQPLITHDGTQSGFRTSVLLVPGADVGIVVMINIGANFPPDPVLGARSAVAQKLAFRFYDLYFGRHTSEAELEQHVSNLQAMQAGSVLPYAPPGVQAPGLPLKNYEGVYFHPAYGRFVVSLTGSGNLVVTMGPLKMHARMKHKGGNTFWAYLPDYPDEHPFYIPLTFKFPSSGPATMTIGTVMGWSQNDVFIRKNN